MRNVASLARSAPARANPLAPPLRGYAVSGTGPVVLLLHASLGSKSQWRALCERLSTRFRVIAVDLWGYGDNAGWPPSAPFALDEEVQLVAERLDALVPPRAAIHVAGHSYGGLVALRLAQRNVRRTISLTLYEPVVMRLLDARERAPLDALAREAAWLVSHGRHGDAAGRFVDFWSGEGTYARLPAERQLALAARVDKVPLDFAAAASWPSDTRALHRLDVPTMLLTGNRSPAIVQRIVDRLGHVLPRVRVTTLDAGHMGPVTHAERVNPWIEAFIDRCTPDGCARAWHLAPWRSQGAAPAV